MITCTLGDKKYTVDFVSGRALREMEPALKMYVQLTNNAKKAEKGEKIEDESVSIADAIDVMARWFCVLFGNQFTVDELYDGYPADRILFDIALALTAVQMQTTSALQEFPTKPTATKATKDKE